MLALYLQSCSTSWLQPLNSASVSTQTSQAWSFPMGAKMSGVPLPWLSKLNQMITKLNWPPTYFQWLHIFKKIDTLTLLALLMKWHQLLGQHKSLLDLGCVSAPHVLTVVRSTFTSHWLEFTSALALLDALAFLRGDRGSVPLFYEWFPVITKVR